MTTKTTLCQKHIDELIKRGFSDAHIETFVEEKLIRSRTADDAYGDSFAVAIDGKPVTGGLELYYTPNFSQLLLDDRTIIIDPKKNTPVKYLSKGGESNHECAYIPKGCKAITEGWIDALLYPSFITLRTVKSFAIIISVIQKAIANDFTVRLNFQP